MLIIEKVEGLERDTVEERDGLTLIKTTPHFGFESAYRKYRRSPLQQVKGHENTTDERGYH